MVFDTEGNANDELDIFIVNEQEREEVYSEVTYCTKWVEESDLYLCKSHVTRKAVEKGEFCAIHFFIYVGCSSGRVKRW